MEHCGDNFLAALADFNQDKEDWDDLQAIESEACGALNDIFTDTIPYDRGEKSIDSGAYELRKGSSLRYPVQKDSKRFCSSSNIRSDLELNSQKYFSCDPSPGFDMNEVRTEQAS